MYPPAPLLRSLPCWSRPALPLPRRPQPDCGSIKPAAAQLRSPSAAAPSADAEGCGLQILGDVKPVGADKWDNGWIYDPDRDRKFDVELTPLGTDKLRVMGYAGMKWLNETMIWKRAPDGLTKCSKTGATAAATPVMEKKAETPRPAATSAATDKASTAATAAKGATAPELKAASQKTTAGQTKPADEVTATGEAMKGRATETKKEEAKNGDFAGMLLQLVGALADSVDEAPKGKSVGSKETCSAYVPDLEMTLSFPCFK
jgi:Uncharacterized protein conserved in bacteria (DUF2147)